MGNIIEKLMIGDFIYVWNPYVVGRVEGIDMTTNKIKVHVCDKLDEHCEVDANDCSLIPITEDVIEENMTLVDENKDIKKYRDNSAVLWISKDGENTVYTEAYSIEHVNELQHFLNQYNRNCKYKHEFKYTIKL